MDASDDKPSTQVPEALFYDGTCGLCHRWVKRVIRADRDGSLFYFAPLQGEAIKDVLNPKQIAALPDSIVVYTHGSALLTRTAAIIHILGRLGGWHGRLGRLLTLVPRPIRDFGYDCVAKVRHRLYARPKDACPVLAPELRSRFRF